MSLVRLRYVMALVGLALIASLGSSVWAYRIGMAAGLKGDAETMLFAGLVLSALEAGGLLLLIAGSRRKSHELETLTDLVRYGGTISDGRLDSFGVLGRQLKSILRELADASERKSLRIASLTGLLRTVMDMVERPLLIIGLDGRIVASSKGADDDESFSEPKIGESKIEEFVEGIDLRVILGEADRSHSVVERAGSMLFIPVYSVNGEITHFLVDMSKKGALGVISSYIQGKDAARRKNHETEPRRKRETGIMGILRKRFIKS